MYIGIKHLHSFLASVALLLLIVATVYAFYCWITNSKFTKNSKIIVLLGLVSAHVQLLIGLVLYFISPLGIANFSGAMMKNSTARLYGLEHPILMIVAVVLITIGYAKAKRTNDAKTKFKTIEIGYGIGLILILIRIPWSSWLG